MKCRYQLELYLSKIANFIKTKYPFIYHFFCGDKYPILRQMLCIPIGFIEGYLFYVYLVYRFDFDNKMEKLIRYVIVALVTVMFTVSIEMRAICCLILPTFLGINHLMK